MGNGMTIDVERLDTSDLVRELERRGAMPRCRCRKWTTYMGAWDRDGYTIRCHGCLRSITRCQC